MGKKLGEFGGILPDLDSAEFRLESVKCQPSQNGGAINIYWNCSIVSPAEHSDAPLNLSCSLTQASEWVVKAYLLAFGASEEDVVPTESPEDLQLFITQRCVGSIARANIRTQNDPRYPTKNILENPSEIENVSKEDRRGDKEPQPDWAR